MPSFPRSLSLGAALLFCACAGSTAQTRTPTAPTAAAAQPAEPSAATAPAAPASAGESEAPPDEPVSRVRWFEALVARTPDDVQAWRGLASALRTTNRLQESARAAWTAVELAPEAWEGWYNVGNVLMQGQSFAQARAAHEEALRLGAPAERAAKGLLDVGYRAWAAGQDELALALYARAGALAPHQPTVEFDRAMLYAQRGDKAKAEAAVRRGLAIVDAATDQGPEARARREEFRAHFQRLLEGERPERPNLLEPTQALPARFHTRPAGPARALALDARAVRRYPAPTGDVVRLEAPTTWSERVRLDEHVTAVMLVAPGGDEPESYFISAHPRPPGKEVAELVAQSRSGLEKDGVQVTAPEPFRSAAAQGQTVWTEPAPGAEARFQGRVIATVGERLITGTRFAKTDAAAEREAFLQLMRSVSFEVR